MRIKGFLAILLLVLVIVFFLFIVKTGKKAQLLEKVEAFNSVKHKLTKTNMTLIQRMITSYIARQGRAPESLKKFQSLQPLGAGQFDAWGKVIKYEKLSDEDWRLTSAGDDGIFNTKDDIVMSSSQ